MPGFRWPDERAHVRSFERVLEGRTIKIHVYAEQYSMWFGLVTWNERHIRATMPCTDGNRMMVRYHHNRKSESVIREKPLMDEQDHIMEVENEVTEWIRSRENLEHNVSYPYNTHSKDWPWNFSLW